MEIVFEGTKITVLEVDRASFSKAALERQITDIIEIASGSLVGQKLSFLFEKQISADAHLFYDINQGTPDSLPVALRARVFKSDQNQTSSLEVISTELGLDHVHKSAFKHRVAPELCKTYIAFSAAYDGCLQCVKHLVEEHGVSATTPSASGTYNMLSWAVHGCDNRPNQDPGVVLYLKQNMALASSTSA